ncbi:hypothetical protein K4K55_000433 [Colletotrichum sp. SAR 10_96]|nr:hypothetical protein K4K55_000433 [Colletotrichum sp. SAR 10_96]
MSASENTKRITFNPWDALNITIADVKSLTSQAVIRHARRAMLHCHPDRREMHFINAFPSLAQVQEARDFLLNEENAAWSFQVQYPRRTFPFYPELERGNPKVFDLTVYPNARRTTKRGDTAPISVAISRELNPDNQYLPSGSFRNPVDVDLYQQPGGSSQNPVEIQDDVTDIINDPEAVIVIDDDDESADRVANAPSNAKAFVGWPVYLSHITESERPIVLGSFTRAGHFIKKVKNISSDDRGVPLRHHQSKVNIKFEEIKLNEKFGHCRSNDDLRREVLRLVSLGDDDLEPVGWVWD